VEEAGFLAGFYGISKWGYDLRRQRPTSSDRTEQSQVGSRRLIDLSHTCSHNMWLSPTSGSNYYSIIILRCLLEEKYIKIWGKILWLLSKANLGLVRCHYCWSFVFADRFKWTPEWCIFDMSCNSQGSVVLVRVAVTVYTCIDSRYLATPCSSLNIGLPFVQWGNARSQWLVKSEVRRLDLVRVWLYRQVNLSFKLQVSFGTNVS